ncbi:hypothetical protein ACFWMR_02325 [Amycolatopsis thailandensis]|uniref:hypothetical protein n=1 Tax=Amycolatopsis thailandensis TaxID=589330 RepID=UPI00364B4803
MTHTQTPAATVRGMQGQIFDICVEKGLAPSDSWNLGALALAHTAYYEDGEIHERCITLKPRGMSEEQLEAILERALADVRQRRAVD